MKQNMFTPRELWTGRYLLTSASISSSF